MKKLLVIIPMILSILACEAGEFIPTFTPEFDPTSTLEEVTETPEPTTTQAPPQGEATPTPICIDEDTCVFPTVAATPLGQEEWEYWIMQFTQIRCVATRSDGSPWECRVRYENSLEAGYDLVPHGTILDSNSIYHCEVYSYCDPYVADWYHLPDGRWAASLPGVWEVVELPSKGE